MDARALLHELRVHQVELEMQNEELRHARSEMEQALRRYSEIFDFAPTGYAIVQVDSAITEVNHAGAQMLGQPRAALCGLQFQQLVAHADRSAFDRLLISARSLNDKQSCQLELLRFGGEAFAARLTVTTLVRSEPTLLLAFEHSAAP